MTSVKIKFRPSTIDGKEGILYFQVIHRRVVRQIITDYHLYETEWDATDEWLRMDGPRTAYLRSVEERILWDQDRLQRVVRQLDGGMVGYHVRDVVTAYQKLTEASSLFSFMKKIIDELRDEGRIRSAEAYQATLSSFRQFREETDLPVDAITGELIKRYEAYLKKRMVSMNTVSFYMRILRATYNRSVEEGLTEQRWPFRNVYTGIEKTRKRALPVRTIKKLRQLDLGGKPSQAFARDLFLFSFFTRGMSFVDMAFLKKSDLKYGVLTYRRRKTGQLLTIKWERCMEEIVRRYPNKKTDYLLPLILSDGDEWRQYRNALHLTNYYLKQISEQMQLEYPITMYVARHSWASAAKTKKIPISVISQGLGHDSQTTTQIYLAALEASVVDKANRLVIGMLGSEC